MKNYVRMTDRDNVVTMLRHLDPGEIINVDGVKIKATHDVPAYHKSRKHSRKIWGEYR